jgi:hypothetical protein
MRVWYSLWVRSDYPAPPVSSGGAASAEPPDASGGQFSGTALKRGGGGRSWSGDLRGHRRRVGDRFGTPVRRALETAAFSHVSVIDQGERD